MGSSAFGPGMGPHCVCVEWLWLTWLQTSCALRIVVLACSTAACEGCCPPAHKPWLCKPRVIKSGRSHGIYHAGIQEGAEGAARAADAWASGVWPCMSLMLNKWQGRRPRSVPSGLAGKVQATLEHQLLSLSPCELAALQTAHCSPLQHCLPRAILMACNSVADAAPQPAADPHQGRSWQSLVACTARKPEPEPDRQSSQCYTLKRAPNALPQDSPD